MLPDFSAKLGRPSLHGVVARPSLHALLDDATARPIVWMAGPPGAGKTTLAASWIEASGRPCLWYHVDDRDDDPGTFFYYLGMAARPFTGDRPLPVLGPHQRSRLAAFGRAFFEALFAILPRPAILCFDDCDGPRAWLEPVIAGLAVSPPGVSTLFTSRDELPASLARPLAQRRVAIIDPAVFELSRDETVAIARASLGAAGDGLAPQIQRLVGGWAAGHVLLLEWARRAGALPDDLTAAGSLGLFDYFATEVFARVEPDVARVLLETALLPSVTPALAVELSGVARADRILAELHRQSFFVERCAGDAPAYRYHAAFRAFLVEQLRGRAPRARSELERRSAEALLAAARGEEALPLFLRAGEDAAAAAIVRELAGSLCAQGRGDTLAAWIDALPEARLAADPWLGFWRGVCAVGTSVREAERRLAEALDRFHAAGDAVGAYTAWVELVEVDALAFDEFDRMPRRLEQYARLVADFPHVPAPALDVRVATARFLTLSYHRPEDPEVGPLSERLLRLVREHGDAVAALRAGALLVGYHTLRGDDARVHYIAEVVGVHDGPAVPAVLRVFWLTMLALQCSMGDDYDEGLRRVATATALLEEERRLSPTALLMYRGLSAAAGVMAVVHGDLPGARRVIARMNELIAAGDLPPVSSVDFCSTALYLDEGDAARALAHGPGAIEETRFNGHRLGQEYGKLLCAQAYAAGGELARARELIDAGLAWGREAAMPRLAYLFGLVDIDQRLAAGEGGVDEALRTTLALGRESAYAGVRACVSRPLLTRVCAEAARRGVEPTYVAEIARRLRLELPAAPSAAPATTRIEVRAFGPFSVAVAGAPLRSARKPPRRPLALLKALIAFGERDVSEATLESALWPDAEGDAAHDALEVTVRRLRLLCGDKEALIRQGGRLSLDETRVWTDVRAFHELCRTIPERPAGATAAALRARLGELCRGDFLADEDEPWALAARERLRAKLARALAALGDGPSATAGSGTAPSRSSA